MLRNVFSKTIYDHRTAVLAWAAGTGFLSLLLIVFYPFIRDSDAMGELFEEMPAELMSLFGIDPETFTTAAGYLSGQMYSFIGPILMVGFAVNLGVAITSAEERDNTLDMLLSAPISRTHTVLSKMGASALLAGALPVTMALALVALNDPVGMLLPIDGILSMNVSLWMLGLLFGSVAAAVGAFTGRPGPARGIALTVAILSWFATAFEAFFDWLSVPATLSPFTWYMDRNLFLDPWSAGAAWLAVSAIFLTAVTTFLFSRRDLATELSVLPAVSLTRKRSKHIQPRRTSLLRSVAGKTTWDRRRTVFFWAAGIASLLLVTFSAWPALSGNAAAMQAMVEALPSEIFAMFGMTDFESLTTPAGFISSRAYLNMGPLIMILFTVGGVSALTAREEKAGVLDMVLSNPQPRRAVLVGKIGALAGQTLFIAGILTVVAFAGNAIWDTNLVPINMIGANLGLALLGLFFGGMALALWSLMPSGGAAIGITSAVAVVSYFVNGLGSIIDPIAVVRPLSPFYWYIGDTAPLAKGIEPIYLLLLIGAVVFAAIAAWRFERRDLAV